MRKTIFTLGLMLAAALSLTNCTKNEEATFTPEVKVPFELYANMDDTRTTNNGLSTKWEANDAINVFHAVADTEGYENDGKFTTENGDGKFKGSLANTLTADAYDWYACYPYKSYMTSPNNTSESWLYVGSRSDKAQTQTGNNSMAHIAGEDYPLYGVAEDVAASAKPSITMSHASSLVEFNVTNKLSEEITVTSIKFIVNGEVQIVGQFFMAIHDGTPTFTNGDNTSNEATLNVTNGEAIAAGESAKFYMAIKPFFSDEFDMEVIVDAESATGVGTCSKELGAVTTTFYPGKIKTLNVGFDAVMAEETAKELPFSETFGTSQGEFTIEDVELGSLSYVWSFAEGYGMKASGYYQGAKAAQSKLVSPLIAIPAETEGAPILTFDHCVGYGNSDTKDELTLWIKAKAADWQQVTIPNYPTISSSFSSFVSSGDIDLSAYKGQEIYVAFEYSSTTSNASTWEIKNVLIETSKLSQTLSFPAASYTVKVGDSFTAPLLSGAKTAVTYTSSNTEVANVNATTGAITLGNTPGNTIITATAAEDATYNSASASYTIVLEDASIVTATGTIDFSTTDQRESQDSNSQVWSNAGITLINSKESSTTNVADYSNPARFYKSSSITISAPDNITQLYFECSSTEYATALKNSVGSAATASGTNVTVVLDGTSDTFTATLSEGKVFVNSLSVTYITMGQELQTLSFNPTEKSANLGEDFTEPILSGAMTTVTYSSSNTAVAEVDVNTGEVTLKGAGETKITATAEKTDEYFKATASYTLTVIDPDATVDYTTLNTSNVTLSTNGVEGASTAKVKVDGHEYDAIKLGTSKVVGTWKVTVPAGTTKLHLHLAGWNSETVKVNVSGATVDNSSLSVTSDSGIASNSPFTLSKTDSSSFYHELTLSNVTAATTLTFTATQGKRFVVWGVNAEIPE